MSRMRRRAGIAALVVLVGTVGIAVPASIAQTAQDRIVSPVPAKGTPNIRDGRVFAVAKVGDTVVVGGTFSTVTQHFNTHTRNYILAFDARTGDLDMGFVPDLNGAVFALWPGPDGNSVYVGGAFYNVNGRWSRSLARLDLDNGQPVPGFNVPAIDHKVRDIQVAAGRLYLAGSFTHVGGVPHSAIAVLDAQTGQVRHSAMDVQFAGVHNGGRTRVERFAVSPDGSRLLAIGNFSQVDGIDRRQIAMLDTSGSSATVVPNWRTEGYTPTCSRNMSTYMRDVDFSPDGSYFVVVTTGAPHPGTLCDAAARWETGATGSDVRPTWVDVTGGDTLLSVAVTGTAVYVGGHQRWLNNPAGIDDARPGAVSRPGIAALDPVNGLPYSWNPRRIPRGYGAAALLATEDGLIIGHDTWYIGDREHFRAGVAFFPLMNGKVVPPGETADLPANAYLLGQRSLLPRASEEDVVYRSYDGSTVGESQVLPDTGIAWDDVRGAALVDGVLWYGWSNGNFYRRTFDGQTFGPASAPDPYSDPYFPGRRPNFYNEISRISGMFFADGRLYYTVSGRSDLYYRYFTPESGIVGAQRFTVASDVDWDSTSGMFLSGSHLYYATSNERLHRVDFVNGRPVTGTSRVVSAPGVDGVEWNTRALVLDN